MKTVHTYSEKETIALGGKFSKVLQPKDVVLLSGTLGAGKTTFVKGVVKGFGCRKPVLSPSFTLARHYQGRQVMLYHVDLYRIDGTVDAFSLEMNDYLYSPKSITLIEWGEKTEAELPCYFKVVFSYNAVENKRKIVFSAKGYGNRLKVI